MFIFFFLAQSFLFIVVSNSELSKYQQTFDLKLSDWQISFGVNQTSICTDSITAEKISVFGGKSAFGTKTIITSNFQTKGKMNSFYKIDVTFSIFKSSDNIPYDVFILFKINGQTKIKIPYRDQTNFFSCEESQSIMTNYVYEYEIEGDQFKIEFTQETNATILNDLYWGIAKFELNTYECDSSLCSKCTGLPRNCTVFCDISCSNCTWQDPKNCTKCSSPSILDSKMQKCGFSNEVKIGEFFSPLTIDIDLANLLQNKSLEIYSSTAKQWISSCFSHKIFGGSNIFSRKTYFVLRIPIDFNFYATRIDFRFFKIDEWINYDYFQLQGQLAHYFPYPQNFEALTGNICGDSSDGFSTGEIINHLSVFELSNLSPIEWTFSTSLSSDFGSWGVQSLFLTAYKCSDVCLNCSGPTASDCIECLPTHIKINKICVKCQDPCLTCNNYLQTWCNSCSAPLFLYTGGKCIEGCPLGYYGENNTCYNCLENCENCSSLFYCLKCQRNLYAWEPNDKNKRFCWNETFCNNLLSYYADKTNFMCSPCDVSCDACSFSASNCTECAYSYYHSSSSPFTCLKECPVGEYKENITHTCTSCPPACSSCYKPDLCLSCSHSFFLLDSTCRSDCPFPLFADSISNKCLSCTSPCKTCHSSSVSCTSCTSYFLLDVSSCVDKCPITKFPNLEAICQDCTPPCDSCHLSSDRCTSCVINFLDKQKEKCVDIFDCPQGKVGYEKVCVSCKTPCATCVDRIDKCSECIPDFFLNLNFNCLQGCDLGYYPNKTNWKCSKCDVSCLECRDEFKCTKCAAGQFLSQEKCLTVCNEGFWGDRNEGKCVECSKGCKTCLNSSNLACLSCQDQFFLFENSCLTSCSSDKSIYPDDKAHQCQSCHSWCSICLDGTPSNCSKCNSNFFLFNFTCSPTCPPSFYPLPSNSSCQACNHTCSSCNSSYCFDCSTGFFLHNGLCLEACPSNFYADSSSRACTKCPSTCFNCRSALNCSSCVAPFLLHDNECLSDCPPQTFPSSTSTSCETCVSPCLNCISSTTCQTCLATYFFSDLDGKCAQDCPKGYFPSEKDSKCISCNRSCAECSSSGDDHCSKCNPSYFLDMTTCSNRCPNGTYAEEKTWKCEKCDLPCATCYAQSDKTCYSCNQDYYLKENHCTQDCGDGFYPDKISSQCKKCPLECSTCESQEICLSCSASYYFNSFNKTCSNSCPITNYKNDALRSCMPCHSSCASCTSPSQTSCLSCNLPLYLSSSSCLQDCQSKFYPSSPPPICEPCTTDCLSCIPSPDSLFTIKNPLISSKCTLCPSGLLIDQSFCVKSCPYKTYSNSTHCLPCHFSCTFCYEGSNTTCTTCASPFFLLNNSCLDKCPRNLYSDPIIRSCYKKCHYSCQDCEGPNEDECSSCVEGVGRAKENVLKVGKCECIEGWFERGEVRCGECMSECLECSEGNMCTSCRWNRRLKEGRCRCLTGFYDNGDGINCLKCHETCKDCKGAMKNDCISCSVEKNWALSQIGECLCQVGFYLRDGLFCENCHYTCANCTGPLKTNCIPKQCVGNHYYDDNTNECVCPFWAEDRGSKQNCSNITFLNCHPHCADMQCFGLADSNCYSCANKRRFDNYTCPCVDGYFESTATKTCKQCHYTCKTCTGSLFSDCILCSSVTRGSSGLPVKGVCNCESGKIETLEVKCPSIPLSLDACQKSFEVTVILNTPTMAILALSQSPLIAIKFIEICQFISFLSYLNLQYPLNTKEYFTVLNYFNIDSIFTDDYTLNQTNNTYNSSNESSQKLFRFLQSNEEDLNVTAEQITKSNRFERIKYGEGNFLKNSYTLLIINCAVFLLVFIFNFLTKLMKLEKKNIISKLNKLIVWGLPIRIFAVTSLQLLFYLGLQFSKNNFFSTGPLNIIVTILTSTIFIFLVVYLFKVANRNYAFSEFSNKFVVIWEGTDMYFSYKRNYFFFNLMKKCIFVSFILQTGITPFTQTVGCLATSFIFLIYLIFLNPFLSRLVWIFTIVTEFSLMNLLVVILIYDNFEPEKTTVKLVFGYIIIFSIISTLISTFVFFIIQTFRFIRNFLSLINQKQESNEHNSFEFAIKSYKTQMKKKNHINTVYSKEKQIELERKEDEIRKKEAEKKKIEELEIEKSERSGLKIIFLKHKNKSKKKKNSIDMDLETEEFSEENENNHNKADIFKERNVDHLEVEMKKYD